MIADLVHEFTGLPGRRGRIAAGDYRRALRRSKLQRGFLHLNGLRRGAWQKPITTSYRLPAVLNRLTKRQERISIARFYTRSPKVLIGTKIGAEKSQHRRRGVVQDAARAIGAPQRRSAGGEFQDVGHGNRQ
jgi:hypothetical protein